MAPEITRVERIEFKYWIEDLGWDENSFNFVYDPGNSINQRLYGLKIHTDVGVTGEYVGGSSPGMAQGNMFADYLVGKNPLHRERHWSEIKPALLKYDRMGIGPVDIALWDFAGKYHDSPIHELLGTYRTRIPAYASTYTATRTAAWTARKRLPTLPRSVSRWATPASICTVGAVATTLVT